MKNSIQETQALTAVQNNMRVDIYSGIHKAMRALMADTLLAVGRMDPGETEELAATGGRVTDLLDFCAAHLEHENTFVHPAIEARTPGASKLIANEHEEHLKAINNLKDALSTMWAAADAAAATDASLDLYRRLSLFVADNLQHMHLEETEHNAALWASYTDEELITLHDAIKASISPRDMMFTLRWLVPAMSPGERTAMLSDMQAHAPAPAFAEALEVVRPHLSPAEWAKLSRSLGLPPVTGLVTV